MKKILLALLLLTGVAHADLNPFNYPKYVSSTSSGGATSPGGTVTGANQYRSAGGTFAGDDSIVDNGSGLLTLVGVSASSVVSASQVAIGDGTTSLPSIFWRNSTQTGWYRAGNNQPNMVIAGSVIDRISGGARGLMVSNNTTSATFQVGTQCQTGSCPGSGVFAGQLSVNTGSTGTSITVPGGGGLYVSGTSYIAGGISATSSVFFTNMGTGTAISNVCTTSTGQIISTTTLSGCLGVSDPLLKKGIRLLPYGLAEVMAIDPVMYRDIRTDKGAYAGEQIGLLAYSVDRDGQRYRGVEAVIPELVDQEGSTYNGKHYKGLIYERLAPVLINAMHEQQAEIDELRATVGLPPQRLTFGARLRWLLTGQ